jgi:hypothetical protein
MLREALISFYVTATLCPMAAAQVLDDHKSYSATPLPVGIEGKWTYRSFHNRSEPVGDDAEKALKLIFAEAEFTFQPPTGSTLEGKIDWPGGGLDLRGTIRPGVEPNTFVVDLVGSGRPYTATAGWEYDYHAQLAHHWPNGVNQRPVLVGSVLRAKPHGSSPAG